MKKIIFTTLSLIFLFTNLSNADDNLFLEELEPYTFKATSSSNNNSISTYSKSITAYDRKTGIILYEKNSTDKLAMASTTKIMTCILALEKLNYDKNPSYKISKSAASATGSTLGLKEGSSINLHDLLYGLMLRSGNDCAILLAEIIGGNIENFSKLMNEKAQNLNLKNTNFVTPHGLDDESHYSTAKDLAILTDYALKNDSFRKIVGTNTCNIILNGNTTCISNTNELLGNLSGIYGVKTGFTFNAGRCLISSYKDETFDLIIVVLGADSKKIRSKDTKTIINYIKNNYKYINLKPTIHNLFNGSIKKSTPLYSLEKTTNQPTFYLENKENLSFPLLTDGNQIINSKLYINPKYSHNMPKDSLVGKYEVYSNNTLLTSFNVYLEKRLNKNTFTYYFKKCFKNLIF